MDTLYISFNGYERAGVKAYRTMLAKDVLTIASEFFDGLKTLITENDIKLTLHKKQCLLKKSQALLQFTFFQ